MILDIISLLQNATITVPVIELCVLVTALSVFLVFKLPRIGLITAYLFVYRWGLLFFLHQATQYLMFYLVFGFAIGVVTIVSMIWSSPPAE
jgi:hypothetical protein